MVSHWNDILSMEHDFSISCRSIIHIVVTQGYTLNAFLLVLSIRKPEKCQLFQHVDADLLRDGGKLILAHCPGVSQSFVLLFLMLLSEIHFVEKTHL